MVPLLTLSLAILGLGLVLLLLGIKGRSPGSQSASGAPEAYETAAPAGRRIRIVPLALGLVLALGGGACAAAILTGDADRYDKMVLAVHPAGWLVDDLNSNDSAKRSAAYHELTRRYEADELADSAHSRLVARKIAHLIGDLDAPEMPIRNAPVVDVDIVKARQKNLLGAKEWSAYVARSSPLRLDVPRSADFGQPIQLRVDSSLQDPLAPAWVIIKVEGLKIGETALDAMPAVAVAANPDWKPAPPAEPTEASEDDAPQTGFGGGAGRPPVLRRVVRYPHTVPAELIASLGQGTFPVTGKIVVLAFDPSEVPPPIELMNDQATGVPRRQQSEENLAATTISAQLTPEQFEQFRARAQATHEWPVKREIRLGTPPATQPQQPAENADAEGGQTEGA